MCGHITFKDAAMLTLHIATGFLQVPEESHRYLLDLVHGSHFLCRRAFKFMLSVDIARQRAADDRATLADINPNTDAEPGIDELGVVFPTGDDDLDGDAVEWIECCDGFDIDHVAFGGFNDVVCQPC